MPLTKITGEEFDNTQGGLIVAGIMTSGGARIGSTSSAVQYSTLSVIGDSAIIAAGPTLNLVGTDGLTRYGYLYHGGAGGDLYLTNQQNGNLLFSTNNTERARFDSSGRLGIGTVLPITSLTISGSSLASGELGRLAVTGNTSAKRLAIGVDSDSTMYSWMQSVESGINFRNLILQPLGGNLGISTASPQTKLHVNGGSLRVDSGGYSLIVLGNDTSTGFHISKETDSSFNIWSGIVGSGTNRLRIDSNGTLCLGTTVAITGSTLNVYNNGKIYVHRSGYVDAVDSTNSNWADNNLRGQNVNLCVTDGTARLTLRTGDNRLYLTGSASRGGSGYPVASTNDSIAACIRANGYIEWQTDAGAVGTNYFLSDESKKNNIAPSTFNSSQIINNIKFIEFDWKPDSGNEGHVDVGVSAQQLQSIDGRLVHKLLDDTLMINEPALMSHLAKSLQEALSRIETLENEIQILKSK